MSSGIKFFRIAAVSVMAVMVSFAVIHDTQAQPTRAPVEQLAEDLDLSFTQLMDLKTVFEEYNRKMMALAEEERAGEEVEIVVEKKQRLQREFYEELVRILTPEQISKYNEFRNREVPADKEKNPRPGNTNQQPEKVSFPWVNALKYASEGVEISGLQQQAMNGMFSEIEMQASQMLYLDQEYDPSQDEKIIALLETKLEWILTPGQYAAYVVALKEFSAREKNQKETIPQDIAPESGIE